MLGKRSSSFNTKDFSPFKERLNQVVVERLRHWCALDDGQWDLRWRVRERTAGVSTMVEVEVRSAGQDEMQPPSLEFELRLGPGEGPAWVSSAHAGLSYRRLPGMDDAPPPDSPLGRVLDRAAERFTAVMEPDGAEEVEALRTSIAKAERLAEVRDEYYRRIGWSNQGRVRYATIRLGFRCNQDCGFCWQGRDWPDADEADYHRWVDEAAAAGVGQIVISGGEPTLNHALPSLIERAVKHHRIPTTLQTNAIRLRDPRFAARLKEAGVSELFVSLHSSDPEVSDLLTRAPGTYLKTVAGISTALAAGLDVGLNCVVEQRNYKGLTHHASHIVQTFLQPGEKGINRMVFSHPCQAYGREAWRESAVSLEAIRPHLVAACGIIRDAGISVDVVGSGCSFPPCTFRDAPEFISLVQRSDFDETDVSSRVFAAACDGCAIRSRCLGLRSEYLDMMGQADVVPFTQVPTRWRLGSLFGKS